MKDKGNIERIAFYLCNQKHFNKLKMGWYSYNLVNYATIIMIMKEAPSIQHNGEHPGIIKILTHLRKYNT